MSNPRKIRCAVEAITPHGGRVYTVDLLPATPAPAFRPGQFLHLTVEDYDPAGFWPESRVFSIASSPQDRQRLRICFSVKGRYTTRMEQTLRVGAEVWVKLPYGDFVIDHSRDAVLLAGGTGISAFSAFLEGLEPCQDRSVLLAYGARTPNLFLFGEMVLRQLDRVPSLGAVFFAEQPDPEFAARMTDRPRGPRLVAGRISLAVLWETLKDPVAKVFYLSGPPLMLQVLRSELGSRGVPPAGIVTDAWE